MTWGLQVNELLKWISADMGLARVLIPSSRRLKAIDTFVGLDDHALLFSARVSSLATQI